MRKSVFTPTYSQFKRLLIEARQTAGFSQAELAQKLSKPQSFVSKFERGERRLDVVEFLEIARVLNLDPVAFIRQLIRLADKQSV